MPLDPDELEASDINTNEANVAEPGRAPDDAQEED